jgi:hypothetical protein
MLISIPGLARETGLSEKTLRKYRERLPGATVIGRRVLYRKDLVLKFIEAGGAFGAIADGVAPAHAQ